MNSLAITALLHIITLVTPLNTYGEEQMPDIKKNCADWRSCPCGTGKDYNNCCQPLHRGAFPEDALALMRSRYSAYAYGFSEYIIRTTDPKNINYQENHTLWAKEISERCQNTQFQKLDILEFTNGPQEAYVTFIAHFLQNNRPGFIHEKSRFRKIGPQWLYLEAVHLNINNKISSD
jgi:SEC-C motif-containing protein